jgi:hypothetical protein
MQNWKRFWSTMIQNRRTIPVSKITSTDHLREQPAASRMSAPVPFLPLRCTTATIVHHWLILLQLTLICTWCWTAWVCVVNSCICCKYYWKRLLKQVHSL